MKKIVSNYDELYPGRFLKSGEVVHNPIYTIKEVYLDNLETDEGGERPKGVLNFEEIEQEMTLNKTKGECLKAIFGKDLPEWVGKRVQWGIYDEKFGPNQVQAICVIGSPDIEKDITVRVTYRRRKPKDFFIKCLKKQKPTFDTTNVEQVDKFMEYATKNGWEKASKVLAGYVISDSDVTLLKAKFDTSDGGNA